MKIALVFSDRDPASKNMRGAFLGLLDGSGQLGPFSVLTVELNKELVFVEPQDLPAADSYVFLSRHVGAKSCFTIHATGNPGSETKLGGRPRSLGVAAPLLSHAFLMAMMVSSPLPVVFEATHHGPTELDRPCVFVEIGVSESDWTNPSYARFVAGAVVSALRDYGSTAPAIACCFGGPHYASVFTEYSYRNGFALGHIISKHSLVAGDREIVRLATQRCEPRPAYAIIDWDGLRGDQRRTVLEEVGELGLRVVRL